MIGLSGTKTIGSSFEISIIITARILQMFSTHATKSYSQVIHKCLKPFTPILFAVLTNLLNQIRASILNHCELPMRANTSIISQISLSRS
jgi:hypothetical protein